MRRITLLLFLLISISIQGQAQEREILTSDGVKLYVKVKGTGTPYLYLHGGPGSGSHWLEKFFGDYLEQHFQMIYLDQRGVCRSSSPKDNNYSLERMILDFEEVRGAWNRGVADAGTFVWRYPSDGLFFSKKRQHHEFKLPGHCKLEQRFQCGRPGCQRILDRLHGQDT